MFFLARGSDAHNSAHTLAHTANVIVYSANNVAHGRLEEIATKFEKNDIITLVGIGRASPSTHECNGSHAKFYESQEFGYK